jgi:hypothetical protein
VPPSRGNAAEATIVADVAADVDWREAADVRHQELKEGERVRREGEREGEREGGREGAEMDVCEVFECVCVFILFCQRGKNEEGKMA